MLIAKLEIFHILRDDSFILSILLIVSFSNGSSVLASISFNKSGTFWRKYIVCFFQSLFYDNNLHDVVNRADEQICELQFVTPRILVTPLQDSC